MLNLIFIAGLLLAWTFIYAGLSWLFPSLTMGPADKAVEAKGTGPSGGG